MQSTKHSPAFYEAPELHSAPNSNDRSDSDLYGTTGTATPKE